MNELPYNNHKTAEIIEPCDHVIKESKILKFNPSPLISSTKAYSSVHEKPLANLIINSMEEKNEPFKEIYFKEEESSKLIQYIKEYFRVHNEYPPTTKDFYIVGKLLGRGAFGKVSLGVHKLTGRFVAIKSIKKECLTNEDSKNKVLQEFAILKLTNHKNVIKLFN